MRNDPLVKARSLLLVTLLFLAPISEAQMKTYLTMEAGPQWSLLKVVNPGNYFEAASISSSIAGVTIGQEVSRNLYLVTGIYYQPYRSGINMIDDRPLQPRWSGYTSLLIPLKAEYRVQLLDYPVSFTPKIGYVYNLYRFPEAAETHTGLLSAPDGTAFNFTAVRQGEETGRHLLEVGASLGLRFAGLWQASLNLSYLNGLSDPDTPLILLDYEDQAGNSYSSEYHTRGNLIYTSLSFHVPISNIWQNRDYRIRARIENSAGSGKSVDRKGQFYAGGEVGSLWRLFHTSNPALGARPMDERGLFRYANLHAGAYLGYMITGEVGIDLGVNYQRSSIFYSASFDHEVDYVTKSPAPLFLEIPIRVRYFYNLYKEKLYYAVYGGASLLTNFSGAGFAEGEGQFSYTYPFNGSPAQATIRHTGSRTSRFRPVLRAGTGLEYRVPLEFPLIATLYFNYMQGFSSTESITLSSTIPEGRGNGVISYQGTGWSIDLGIKIPFVFSEGGICAPLPEREEEE